LDGGDCDREDGWAAKSGLSFENGVCQIRSAKITYATVTICRVTFCEVTVLADLICSLIEETSLYAQYQRGHRCFEPFFVSAGKIGKLSSLAVLNGVAKKPQEHYQEHNIANDVSTRRNGGLVLEVLTSQV